MARRYTRTTTRFHPPADDYGREDDIECEDDACQDPRCLERREESETLLQKWQGDGQDLAFVYHLGASHRDDSAIDEFERLPNHKVPAKVKLESYTRNEVVLSSGERLKFLLPSIDCFSTAQVTFSTGGKWEASLYPWNENLHKSRAA